MLLTSPPESDAVRAIHENAQADDGYVANFLRLWCWRPEVHQAFLRARMTLLEQTQLSPREIAVLNVTTASGLGDAYCSLAWGTKLAGLTDASSAASLLRGEDSSVFSPRERALASWARAVVQHPNDTTVRDVEALREAGLSDQDIFDATALVAFRLAFGTVNDALGARPDRKLADDAPPEVRAGITYGRTVAELVENA